MKEFAGTRTEDMPTAGATNLASIDIREMIMNNAAMYNKNDNI